MQKSQKHLRLHKATIIFLGVLVTLYSCSLFSPPETGEGAVARYGNNYLYKEDLARLLPANVSERDSSMLVSNYINQWATKQMLVAKAEINISEEKLESFEDLVQAYKEDLYARAYKEALVIRDLDSVVTPGQLEQYYNNNLPNFKLNEELLQLRYIELGTDQQNTAGIRNMLRRFNVKDKRHLDSLSLQYKSYNLNDSVWVKTSQLIRRIRLLNTDNKHLYLKNSQNFELRDSLGVYLVAVTNLLKRNDTAPLSYVEPTIKQIILNKRKLELVRKLEGEILNEAIEKKEFEVYVP